MQICLALKHVHDRKILHRDIKSQVLLCAHRSLSSAIMHCIAKTSVHIIHLEHIFDKRRDRTARRFWHCKGSEQVSEIILDGVCWTLEGPVEDVWNSSTKCTVLFTFTAPLNLRERVSAHRTTFRQRSVKTNRTTTKGTIFTFCHSHHF